MMSDETGCPLNVYMFVESPDVNRSKMRIDELSSQDNFAFNADLSTKLGAWANDQLAAIEENQKIEQEAAEKTDKKKPAAKKKTTKKTAKKE